MLQPSNESTLLSYQGDRNLTFQTFCWTLRNLTFVTDINYLAGMELFHNFTKPMSKPFDQLELKPKNSGPPGL